MRPGGIAAVIRQQNQGQVQTDHDQYEPPGFLDDTGSSFGFRLTAAIEWRAFFLEKQDDSVSGTKLSSANYISINPVSVLPATSRSPTLFYRAGKPS